MQRIAKQLVREIARDLQLNAALARVLLAESSSSRRKQARDFTDLLSDAKIADGAEQLAFLRSSHCRYLAALEATLDHLLGTYADGGGTQVATWFKEIRPGAHPAAALSAFLVELAARTGNLKLR